MRRNAVIAALVAIAAGVLVYWLWPRDSGETTTAAEGETVATPNRVAGTRTGPMDRTPGSIAGTVVDGDGAPVAGATVSVARQDVSRGERAGPGGSPEPIAMVTGADGEFRVASLPPGRYTASATAARHLPARAGPIALAPGQQVTGVELTLRRGGHLLEGTVSDIGGGPIGGALVRATNMSDGDVFEFFRAPATTASDADGHYQINLGDGAYLIEVFHLDYVANQRFVQISGGDRTEDFSLVPGGVIYGEVRSRGTDEPIAGANVVYTAAGGRRRMAGGGFDLGAFGLRAATTDANGKFALRGLTTGTVEVRAFGPGFASREPTEVALAVGEQVEDVVVYVDRAFSISGYVVDRVDDKRGIEGVLVGAFNFGGTFHLAREASAEDGYFEIHGVQNGSYIVGAAGEGRVVNIMGTGVTVENEDVKDVYVLLDAGVTLSGRVSPPGPARVSLEIESEKIGLGNIPQAFAAATLRTRAGDDGSFELRGVPSGSFRLVGRADDGAIGAMDVEVAEADMTDLVIELQGRASIAGTVVDANGAPAPGLQVRASRNQGRGQFFSFGNWLDGTTITGEDGSFKVVGVDDGGYQLTVSDSRGQLDWGDDDHADNPSEPIAVTVENGQPVTGVRLVVEARSKSIEGVVLGPGGAPAADAWVTARVASTGDGPRRRGRGSWRQAEPPVLTDSDGRFVIRQLRDASYDLEAEGLKGSARGSADKVRAGTSGARIELATLAGVTGVVTLNGDPVRDYVLQARGPSNRRSRVVSDQGRYRLNRLDAGDYELSVIAENGRATGKVEVRANQTAERDLQLVSYGSVRGVVIDTRTGEPMDGMSAAAFSDQGSDTERMALEFLTGEGPRTDDKGRFRVDRLGAGKGTLIIFDGDVGGFEIVAQKEFTLDKGENLDIGEIHGTSVISVPKEKRGEIGMVLSSATWSGRPVQDGEEAGDPPDGIDPERELLWVLSVDEGGPAARAGLEPGDRIVSVAGAQVDLVGANVIERMLTPRRIEIGQPIAFVYERDGQRGTASVIPIGVPVD